MNERVLDWEGCTNVRDLGGLRIGDGKMTRRGAVVRSDTPARLTATGWSALYAYGIRTIVTLHTDGIVEEDLVFMPPYSDIATARIAIEDLTDKEFVEQWVDTNLWGTPLYYRDALRRWPERHSAVISTIGQASPGGVLFHCSRGHDRTGIIGLLLLAFVGVKTEDIAADYELSIDPRRDEMLAQKDSSVQEVLHSALDGLDIDRYLQGGGVSQLDLTAVRRRLLG